MAEGTEELDPRARELYRRALDTVAGTAIPFLVGGAYALERYIGVARHTKDVDIYVRPRDHARALQALSDAGYRIEGVFHWVGKAYEGDDCVDVICNASNGATPVDDGWFAHAVAAEVLGRDVRLCPAEELIWTKSFLMERERYDGGDVAHLLLARGEELDWPRLLGRFGAHWRVLLSHLILFGFIYPTERSRVPAPVVQDLLARLQREMGSAPPLEQMCQGTLLSWRQYLVDVEQWGFADARVQEGYLKPDQVARWTEAFRNA